MPKSDQHDDFKDFQAEVRYYSHKWREGAKKDFNFANLKQWKDTIVKERNSKNLPCLVIDRTRVVGEAMKGAEVMNRHQHTLMPRESSTDDQDAILAEAGREYMRHCSQRGDYEQHDSAAAGDAVTCGVGCAKTFVDYERDPSGREQILRLRVPIWDMEWDPLSSEPNMADARGVTESKWVDESEAKSLIGEEGLKKLKEMTGSEHDRAGDTLELEDHRNYEGDSDPPLHHYDSRRHMVRLYEYQRMERRWGTRVITLDLPDDPEQLAMLRAALEASAMNGQGLSIPKFEETFFGETKEDEIRDLNERLESFRMQLSPQAQQLVPEEVSKIEDFPQRRYYRSIHTGVGQVRDRELIDTDGFTYEFITAFEDFSDPRYRTFYGIIKPMVGPQTYANIFFSAAVRQWQMSPKGLWLAERGALGEDVDKFKRQLATDDLLVVEDGALRKNAERIQRFDSAPSFQGVNELLRTALGSIYETVGVDPYTTGTVNNISRTAFAGIQAIQDQTLKNQSQYFDSLRLYRKRTGRQLVRFIEEYADRDHIRGVLSSDQEKADLFIKALDEKKISRELDVVVEETLATQNERRENAKMLLDSNLLPQMQALGVPIPPSVAEAVVVDGDTASELKTILKDVFELAQTNIQIQKIEAQLRLQQMQAAIQQGIDPTQMAPPGGGEAPPPEAAQQEVF